VLRGTSSLVGLWCLNVPKIPGAHIGDLYFLVAADILVRAVRYRRFQAGKLELYLHVVFRVGNFERALVAGAVVDLT